MPSITATTVVGGLLSWFPVVAVGQSPATADFTLTRLGTGLCNEGNPASGICHQYEFAVAVTGDTSGLSAFNLDVRGTNAEVSATYFEDAPNIRGIRGDNLAPAGFSCFICDVIIGDPNTRTLFNKAASQTLDQAGAIFGVGMQMIDIPNPIIPNNDLYFGVPAVLGTLFTPIELIPSGPSGCVPGNCPATIGPTSVDAALYAPGNDARSFLPNSNVNLTIVPDPGGSAVLALTLWWQVRRRS